MYRRWVAMRRAGAAGTEPGGSRAPRGRGRALGRGAGPADRRRTRARLRRRPGRRRRGHQRPATRHPQRPRFRELRRSRAGVAPPGDGLTIYVVLREACPRELRVTAAPFALRTAHDGEVQPDVLVTRYVDLTPKNLLVAPLLLVETLSPSTAHRVRAPRRRVRPGRARRRRRAPRRGAAVPGHRRARPAVGRHPALGGISPGPAGLGRSCELCSTTNSVVSTSCASPRCRCPRPDPAKRWSRWLRRAPTPARRTSARGATRSAGPRRSRRGRGATSRARCARSGPGWTPSRSA